VGAGSQAENENAGLGIAESGNRFAPVFVIAVGTALLAGDLLAVYNQSRTEHARDYFIVENREPSRSRHLYLLYSPV
jgi:hypothetical protein